MRKITQRKIIKIILTALVVFLGYYAAPAFVEQGGWQNSGWLHSFSLASSSAITTSPLSSSGPNNFYEAKKLAKQKIYHDHPLTFYCGCTFDKQGNVDLASCGYRVQQDSKRASRLEWEHIVPISQLASHLDCWKNKLCSKENGERYKGRQCCQDSNASFSKMEADLHNIVPEIGELNAQRSNYRFGVLPHIQPGQFGACQFKVDPALRRVEPREKVRGMIARIYLYISDTYQLRLSDQQSQLFQAWNNQFPPDAWEVERDNRIAKVQGNHNPYVANYEMMKKKPGKQPKITGNTQEHRNERESTFLRDRESKVKL